ncbi:hypothetical protein PspLS_06229 [Pyricularia sp. CBS 133598]|nr:hypothetical protein PspLS_06229 [Pyricularia sp. CBS 133598]
MSPSNLHPSGYRVGNSNTPSPWSSRGSTPVNGSSPRVTQPAAPSASERMANSGSFGGRGQPSNWPGLLKTDPMAQEIERMSRG